MNKEQNFRYDEKRDNFMSLFFSLEASVLKFFLPIRLNIVILWWQGGVVASALAR